MTQDERHALLELLDHSDRWCQDHEARDATGTPTSFDADDAVAWDLTGALCRLFGWDRACALFGQFDRHINGKQGSVLLSRDTGIGAMVALQTFNDDPNRTYAEIRSCIDSMPIWTSGTRADAATPDP